MFERFTDRCRKVMALANQQAQRFNCEYIGSEHILLGLIKEGSGTGATVLKQLEISLPLLRDRVEGAIKAGPEAVLQGKLPQTPRAKKAIEHAIEEARSLGHDYVGTEHLLLGLVRDDGAAGTALRGFGLNIQDVRDEIRELLGRACPPGGSIDPHHPRILLPDCPLCRDISSLSASASFIQDLMGTYAVLSENQGCRGWCVLIVKDHREHMDDLPAAAQFIIFQDVIRAAAAIRSIFPTSGKSGLPPRINYECLGNLVPHIHWHIIPRHADDPEPTKAVWGWPEAQLKGAMTPEERTALIAKLRAAL